MCADGSGDWDDSLEVGRNFPFNKNVRLVEFSARRNFVNCWYEYMQKNPRAMGKESGAIFENLRSKLFLN
jgi:hypothetical protein